MKLKLNPFILYLLRANLAYLIILMILIATTITVPTYLVGKYFENRAKIAELEEKNIQTQIKQSVLAASQNADIRFIDEDLKILKSLIPDTENYFTIVYALEELSRQTNFVITSYTINLAGSSSEKTSLSVTGIGDQESFLKFLKNYNFSGGRLITAEKIEFNRDEFGGSTIALNFYSKRGSAQEDQNVDYQEVLKKISEIRPRVSIALQSEDSTSISYPTKSSPF